MVREKKEMDEERKEWKKRKEETRNDFLKGNLLLRTGKNLYMLCCVIRMNTSLYHLITEKEERKRENG